MPVPFILASTVAATIAVVVLVLFLARSRRHDTSAPPPVAPVTIATRSDQADFASHDPDYEWEANAPRPEFAAAAAGASVTRQASEPPVRRHDFGFNDVELEDRFLPFPLGVRDDARESPFAMTTESGTEAASSPLRDYRIWRMIAAIGLFSVPQFAVITFASIFLHDVCRAGIAVTAGVMIVIQSGAIVARIWSGRWTDKRGNRRDYLRRCSLLVAISFALLAVTLWVMDRLGADGSIKLAIIAALSIVSGICASAWTGIANAELAVQVGIRRVGTALGMCNTAVYTALFFAPYTTPIIAKLWSWPAAWLMASTFAVVANVLFRRL